MTELKSLPLGVYEKAISNTLSWDAKYALARESGYDCIEISIDGTEERASRLYDGGKTIKEVNSAIKAEGIPSYTMALTANRLYPLGSEDTATREKGLDLVRRAVEFATETGIGVIHLAGYDEHGEKCNDRTKKLFRESLEKCARMAEGTPVTLAIETMDVPYMGSCRSVLGLEREIGSEKLKCYIDTGNMTALGFDPADEIRYAGDFVVGAHLKDATPGVMRDVVFGEGIVDFDSSLAAMRDIGFRGCFIAEMWSYDKESFHPYLKTACAFLREKLSKY